MTSTGAVPEIEHLRGCPTPRVESYVVEAGVTAGLATAEGDGTVRGTPMSVMRCMTCGGHLVLADHGEADRRFRAALRDG